MFAELLSLDWPSLLEGLGALLGAAILLFLPIELWQMWRAKRLTRQNIAELLASLSPLLPTLAIGGAVIAFVTAIYTFAATHAFYSLPNTALNALLVLVLVDFIYYWDHRIAHRMRLIWALAHSVHHSSPLYNQTVGLRISFVDGFISPWFYAPLVLIGFHPMLVLGAFAVILGYQQWIHTESVGKLPWLDGWLNTPSNHRVHHGSQQQYLDKNYGAILMVWDRVFGTYEPEVEPVKYGLTQAIPNSNPWHVHTIEISRLIQELRSVKGIKQLLKRAIFMPDLPR